MLAIYFVLLICSFVLSALSVDEGFGLRFAKDSKTKSCYLGNKMTQKFNPLNIFDFYFNYGYWTSSLRLNTGVVRDKDCLQQLIFLGESHKKNVKIFIGSNKTDGILI